MSRRLGKDGILKEIWGRGFAVVHRARDPDLDRGMTLKVPDLLGRKGI